MPRITLIHATPVAIDPVVETFKADWPEADVFSLLEDSLPADLQAAGAIDAAMLAQFSMAQARPAVERRFSKPVLTSPARAVRKLRALLGT
jgi:hypothetical protein